MRCVRICFSGGRNTLRQILPTDRAVQGVKGRRLTRRRSRRIRQYAVPAHTTCIYASRGEELRPVAEIVSCELLERQPARSCCNGSDAVDDDVRQFIAEYLGSAATRAAIKVDVT